MSSPGIESTPRFRSRVRRVEGPPLVSVRVTLPGGARLESHPGLALASGRLLAEGTRRRDWRRIAEETESRGMAVHATAGWDVTHLGIEALAADWELALEWAVELALESSFPAERVSWIARQTAGELASLGELGDVRTGWAFLRQLYGDHPRGRPLQGDPASLERLDSTACARFHHLAVERGPLLTVAGKIDERELERWVEERLELPAGSGSLRLADAAPEIHPSPSQRVVVDLPRGEQAHVFLGRPTVERAAPEVPALLLLSTVLGAGAGLAGRLPTRLREEEGLAYSVEVAAVADAGLDPGRLEIYLATSPERVERAIEAAREELARVVEDGVDAVELEGARAYLLGRLPFARETASQWSMLLADAELYGLPLDRAGWAEERLERVGAPEVVEAARRFLDPETIRVTIGRPRA